MIYPCLKTKMPNVLQGDYVYCRVWEWEYDYGSAGQYETEFPVVMFSVQCQGDEASIFDCKRDAEEWECDGGEVATVTCSMTGKYLINHS